MNREALMDAVERCRGVFFSRTRNEMWWKEEEMGHHRDVKCIALDCDEVLFDPPKVYKE